jgi:hypothetical protein
MTTVRQQLVQEFKEIHISKSPDGQEVIMLSRYANRIAMEFSTYPLDMSNGVRVRLF